MRNQREKLKCSPRTFKKLCEFHQKMYIVCDLAIYPIGTGEPSIRKYLDTCVRLFQKSGCAFKVHASGTTLGGEWSLIAPLIEECMNSLHKQGCQRVEAQMRLCSRTDKTDFVERCMGQQSRAFSQKEE